MIVRDTDGIISDYMVRRVGISRKRRRWAFRHNGPTSVRDEFLPRECRGEFHALELVNKRLNVEPLSSREMRDLVEMGTALTEPTP